MWEDLDEEGFQVGLSVVGVHGRVLPLVNELVLEEIKGGSESLVLEELVVENGVEVGVLIWEHV